MKITKTHGALLGLGVLGATGLLSAIQPAQAAPAFSQVQYRRPYRPYRPYRPAQQTLTGRVTRNYSGNSFLLRADRGSTYRVTLLGGEPRRLSVGDRIQVTGRYTGGSFRAQRWTILRNR